VLYGSTALGGQAATAPDDSKAQYLSPLGEISDVTRQFSKLLAVFDDLALNAETDRFRRDVKLLTDRLYDIEHDSKQLLRDIPDSKPTGATKDALVQEAADLLTLVDNADGEMRRVGSQLRRKNGRCVESYGSEALISKRVGVAKTMDEIASDAVSDWDASALRRQLSDAIEQVNRAQNAADSFYEKLESKPLPTAGTSDAAKVSHRCVYRSASS
jgi:hypothetical protein